ncbi:hypothetical protein [Serratia bockelmannii]|uniref:hypothetical protein n=1 Tax=Serratia bockelmannii TaxID=2703793 RepID=UPI003FA7C531
MSAWLQKLADGGMLLLLVASICLGGYSLLLSHRLELARQQVAEQKKTLAQQQSLITALRENAAQNNSLMAEQQRREQLLRQQGETYQRKYREATQNDECSRRVAPAAVLELLRGEDTASTGTNRSISP